MKKLAMCLVMAAIAFLLSAGSAMASYGTYHILDDATGGDCAIIGVWDAASKTCTHLTHNNTIANNTLSGNSMGVYLSDTASDAARVYSNNFIGNGTQAYAFYSNNIFNSPDGGNYWSDYDTPEKGCADANTDGFCDTPYYFTGGADYLPWKTQSGWTVDTDLDGFNVTTDCNDNEASVHPGAAELKHDGIDQDCNGYDLTIDIVTAEYTPRKDRLVVDATSSLNGAANLSLVNYGPMTWKASQQKWTITVEPAGGNPGTVTVSGVEGSESMAVTVR